MGCLRFSGLGFTDCFMVCFLVAVLALWVCWMFGGLSVVYGGLCMVAFGFWVGVGGEFWWWFVCGYRWWPYFLRLPQSLCGVSMFGLRPFRLAGLLLVRLMRAYVLVFCDCLCVFG